MKLQQNKSQTLVPETRVQLAEAGSVHTTAPDFRKATGIQTEMQRLADSSSKGLVQAKLQSLADSKGQQSYVAENNTAPVQRVMDGEPRSELHMMSQLTEQQHAKLQRAIAIMVQTLEHDPNILVHQLIISVEREGGVNRHMEDSEIAGDNPALTSTIVHPVEAPEQDENASEELEAAPAPAPRRSIEIVLQRPFVAAATEGELLGLLAHEVGVHNIPSDFRNIDDAGVNQFPPVHTPRKADKANTDSGGYEFHDWPEANAGQQRDGAGRQHDHLMVADVLRNPPEVEQEMALTRANVYLQTVLNIGDRIWESDRPLAERRTQASELVHIYLIDIARIVASDDGRMPPREHAIAINDIYGRMFTQVMLPQREQHPWIPADRPKANILTLGISLVSFIRRVQNEKEARG